MTPRHHRDDPTGTSDQARLRAWAAFTRVLRSTLRIAVLLSACLLSLAPALARAEPTERQHMSLLMENYFTGEKSQAYVFLGAGVAALGTSALLFTRSDKMAQGAAYPVAIVGLLEATVGTILLARTDGQIAERKRQIASDPVGFKSAEHARMSQVMKRFAWVEYIEIGAALTGLGLYAYGEADKHPLVAGVGIGLALQSTVLLGLDFLADRRGQPYLDALAKFNPYVSREDFGLRWQTRF
jgi:hypothetical protein